MITKKQRKAILEKAMDIIEKDEFGQYSCHAIEFAAGKNAYTLINQYRRFFRDATRSYGACFYDENEVALNARKEHDTQRILMLSLFMIVGLENLKEIK